MLFFRDGMFVVGPESAGAHPGPACYKKGGPLTVTPCWTAGTLPMIEKSWTFSGPILPEVSTLVWLLGRIAGHTLRTLGSLADRWMPHKLPSSLEKRAAQFDGLGSIRNMEHFGIHSQSG